MRTDKNGKMELIGNGHAVSMAVPTLDEATQQLAKEKYNEAVQDATNRYAGNIEKTLEKSKEIIEQSEQLQIFPLSGNILLRPYSENPFKVMKETESGLIIPGFDGGFQNPDSGEKDKLPEAAIWADVIEVSPGEARKYLKEGDVVLFRNRSQTPVPFLGNGFCATHLNNILAVVNTDLVERYSDISYS